MIDYRYDTQLLIEGTGLDEDAINDYFRTNFQGDCLLAVGDDELFEDVNDLVEPAAVGAGGLAGQEGVGDQSGEAGGGGVGARTEEALAVGDGLGEGETALRRGLGDLGGRVVLGDGKVAHARSPFIWWVGVASRAACSARRAISRR